MSTHLPQSAKDFEREFLAIFGALTMFFALIEYLFPKPFPFFRLGLANIPILLCLRLCNRRQIFMLAGFKVLGQAVLNGTLSSYVFLFSAGGTLVSVIVMQIAAQIPARYVSLIGIGTLGAMAANLVQAWLAVVFIFGEGAWSFVPLFIAAGTISGVVVGIAAQRFLMKSRWLQRFRARYYALYLKRPLDPDHLSAQAYDDSTVNDARHDIRQKNEKKRKRSERGRARRKRIAASRYNPLAHCGSTPLFVMGLLLLPAFLFQHNIAVRAVQAGSFIIFGILAGKSVQWLYFLSVMGSILFFNLLNPIGEVRAMIGTFPITEGALRIGSSKALAVVGMVFISLATVRADLRLPGLGSMFGNIYYHFERLCAHRYTIRLKRLIAHIDHIFYELFPLDASERTRDDKNRRHTDWYGMLFMVLCVGTHYGVLGITRIYGV